MRKTSMYSFAEERFSNGKWIQKAVENSTVSSDDEIEALESRDENLVQNFVDADEGFPATANEVMALDSAVRSPRATETCDVPKLLLL